MCVAWSIIWICECQWDYFFCSIIVYSVKFSFMRIRFLLAVYDFNYPAHCAKCGADNVDEPAGGNLLINVGRRTRIYGD